MHKQEQLSTDYDLGGKSLANSFSGDQATSAAALAVENQGVYPAVLVLVRRYPLTILKGAFRSVYETTTVWSSNGASTYGRTCVGVWQVHEIQERAAWWHTPTSHTPLGVAVDRLSSARHCSVPTPFAAWCGTRQLSCPLGWTPGKPSVTVGLDRADLVSSLPRALLRTVSIKPLGRWRSLLASLCNRCEVANSLMTTSSSKTISRCCVHVHIHEPSSSARF